MIPRRKLLPNPLLAIMAMLATSLAFSPSVLAQKKVTDVGNPEETFSYIESKARDAREQIATLQTFVRFPNLYSHESHTRKLNRIRNSVNEIAEQVEAMHQKRGSLKAWQSELVTRILPKMETLASDTGHAIRFIDSKPNQDFRPIYESYVDDMYDASNGIVRVVDSFLDWADERAEHSSSSE